MIAVHDRATDRGTWPFHMPTLRLATCWVLMAIGIGGVGAVEQRSPPAAPHLTFRIPAQSLATALQAYGQQSGVQVLYESSSAVGMQSTAVEGEFTPAKALEVLLSGTDLEVHYAEPNAITLAPLAAGRAGDTPPADPLAQSDLSLGELRVHAASKALVPQGYSESVQIDIQNALRKDERTRSGSYQALLDLWIDSSGIIDRTQLLRSTGNQDRDAALKMVLRGLTTSRPPPGNIPQPVRIAIDVNSLQ